jgi:hypothetical protein
MLLGSFFHFYEKGAGGKYMYIYISASAHEYGSTLLLFREILENQMLYINHPGGSVQHEG